MITFSLLLCSVQTRNILCKLDHSPGRARANIKGGWQERSFAIIAGWTCNNPKRMLNLGLSDHALDVENNKVSDAILKRHQRLREREISGRSLVLLNSAVKEGSFIAHK